MSLHHGLKRTKSKRRGVVRAIPRPAHFVQKPAGKSGPVVKVERVGA